MKKSRNNARVRKKLIFQAFNQFSSDDKSAFNEQDSPATSAGNTK